MLCTKATFILVNPAGGFGARTFVTMGSPTNSSFTFGIAANYAYLMFAPK